MSGFDANADLVLRWEFDPDEMRKLNIWMTHPQTQEPLKLYYVGPNPCRHCRQRSSQDRFHPQFSTFERMSTYYRYNLIVRTALACRRSIRSL